MWHLIDDLVEWFEDVKAKRKEKYGTDDGDEIQGPVMTNDLAKGRR